MEKLKVAIKWTVMALVAGGTQLQAATMLEELSNPIADGTIVIDGSRSGWTGITPFQIDPNEGSTEDWHSVTIAHDTGTFYVRYLMNTSASLNGSLRIFLDTDQNRETGFIGVPGQLSIGAEYMIEGATIYAFAGGSDQQAFSWAFPGQLLSYNDEVNDDYELALPRSLIGNVTAFNFMLFATGELGGLYYEDFYPDSANLGSGGGYFTYTVPEPTAAGLMLLGVFFLGCKSRRRNR